MAQNTYKDFFLSDQEGSQVEVLKETGGLWLLSLISSVRALRILMDKQPVDDLEGFEYSTVTSFLILQLKKSQWGGRGAETETIFQTLPSLLTCRSCTGWDGAQVSSAPSKFPPGTSSNPFLCSFIPTSWALFLVDGIL